MSAIFIYVTVPSAPEARKIAQAVVTDRLAACANIFPLTQAIFHWEGAIKEADETVIIFKTRASLFPAVEARVKELHSYKVPAIAAVPVSEGHQPYLEWIMAETKP